RRANRASSPRDGGVRAPRATRGGSTTAPTPPPDDPPGPAARSRTAHIDSRRRPPGSGRAPCYRTAGHRQTDARSHRRRTGRGRCAATPAPCTPRHRPAPPPNSRTSRPDRTPTHRSDRTPPTTRPTHTYRPTAADQHRPHRTATKTSTTQPQPTSTNSEPFLFLRSSHDAGPRALALVSINRGTDNERQ